MKGLKNLVIGVFSGSILGWTLGFLRLPNVEKNSSFLVGFVSCLVLVLISLLLLFVWNKNALLLKLIGKNQSEQAIRTHTLLSGTVSGILILGFLVIGFLIFRQNEWSRNQFQLQKEQITQQLALLESSRHSNLNVLINNLFDQIDEELQGKPGRALSDATIDRIAALNYSFQPYHYLKGDSLTNIQLSPERGQLLVLLSSLKLDSSSFNKIKSRISFLGADLEGADLSGMDLSGVDLREANLRKSVLKGVDLSQSDLRKANLWGSNLENANLRKADLQNAVCDWANLINAELEEAMLNGTKMISAKLTNANLKHASIMYADLNSAFLNNARLKEADISFTSLQNANLSDADLENAVMKTTDLSYAILDKTNMLGVNLRWGVIGEKNWLEQLNNWQVKGAEILQEKYDIIEDTGGLGNYRLPPKE